MTARPKNSSAGREKSAARKRSKPVERHHVKTSSSKKTTEDNAARKTSTRLCIKNIPPSFTSLQLKDFLKKEYQRRQANNGKEELVLTDCRVLMHPKKKISRRIAFAGVQSPQMAQRVIELFHQTFAMTSRLSVEFAHAAAPTESKKEVETKKPVEKEPKKEQTPLSFDIAQN